MNPMRKLVILLAFGAIVPGLTATLPGCGPSAPTEQHAAPVRATASAQDAVVVARSTPDRTPAPVPTPDPSPTPIPVPTSSPTPSPVPTSEPTPSPSPVPTSEPTPSPTSVPTDDGLEFVTADTSETASRYGGIAAAGKDTSPKGDTPVGPVQGQPFNWEDGDRTLPVFLQTDLVVEKSSDGLPGEIVEADEGGANVVRSADGQSKAQTLPVFRSESGSLMTLPGGVLLVLSSEWSQSETDAFFSYSDINMDRVSVLSYVANGFFIETEPGFPSLNLANELATLEGVEVSSPNWAMEAIPK